jgi:hypothetical protein
MNENVVFMYNGILFGNQIEWSAERCYNMGESWKYYAKWASVSKDNIYAKCPEEIDFSFLFGSTGVWT